MTRDEVLELMKRFTKGTSSGVPKAAPDKGRNGEAFWRESNKHKRQRIVRDFGLVKAYCQVVLASGSSWKGEGIRLRDGYYLVCDKAVMNAALNAGLVTFGDGCFRLEDIGRQDLFGGP